MFDIFIKVAKNCLIVFTIFMFGYWVTDGNFQNMLTFLLSGIIVNQLIILDRLDELE